MRTISVSMVAACLVSASVRAEEVPRQIRPVPGRVITSWVGNSFGGDGGANGFGYWVQNAAARSVVTPDGTVIAGIDWDEAGRCVGLYKDGRTNRVLLKAEGGSLPDSAWGWGTGNDGAIAAVGSDLYVGTKGKKLLHFRWQPGQLDSVRFVGAADLPAVPVALSARGGVLAVVSDGRVERWSLPDRKPLGAFAVAGVRDAALARDGSIWILAGGRVRHFSAEGKDLHVELQDAGTLSALAFAHHDDSLLVCDDGPRQQVLVYDVTGERARRIRALGHEGGLRAGVPGQMVADKFFSLRGAGTDQAGNLYVAMSFGKGPCGSLTLRSLSPQGTLRWELYNQAFVDTFGFDPDADGRVVYGRLGLFNLDVTRTKPGSEGSLLALTVDPLARPSDPRLTGGASVLVRRLEGRRLLYTIGQYGGGYQLFTFAEPAGLVARRVAEIHAEDSWAWDVDAEGAIWYGDAPKRSIRRYPFRGWDEQQKPRYDWSRFDRWDWPDDFELVRRVVYRSDTDSLYLFGYRNGEAIDSWGVVGRTARRYDGWHSGKPTVAWTKALPLTPDGDGQGKPLSAESVAVVGDYLFVGMCKPQDGRQYVYVFANRDFGYVGSLWPGESVGGQAGWLDMPYAIQGLQRQDGEYRLLVEEDFRGKNLLYRWRPEEPRP
jgi:hypothetical protein